MVKKVVASGADILVKDKFGVYSRERTNYLSIKLRYYLRKIQQLEIVKRRKNRSSL